MHRVIQLTGVSQVKEETSVALVLKGLFWFLLDLAILAKRSLRR
jgi:hypothetical protein